MRRAIYRFFSGGFEISGNAASFLAENEKKDDSNIVFSVGAVDGTCSATLRAQAFRTPSFAPLTRLLSRRGLKTAHCAVFLTSRSSSLLPYKKKTCTMNVQVIFLVRSMGLEPIRSPIRPSNVRVCLFRHDRKQDVI